MKILVMLLFTLLLVGCTVGEEVTQDGEEVAEVKDTLTGSFKLTAAQGYVAQDNYEVPHTYVIDTDKEEVYVDIYEEGMTEEEREAFVNMSDEEIEEYFSTQPVHEEPIYNIILLEATRDAILLDYEDESNIFTALSNSTFETEDGTRYTIEEEVTIDEYIESFFE